MAAPPHFACPSPHGHPQEPAFEQQEMQTREETIEWKCRERKLGALVLSTDNTYNGQWVAAIPKVEEETSSKGWWMLDGNLGGQQCLDTLEGKTEQCPEGQRGHSPTII